MKRILLSVSLLVGGFSFGQTNSYIRCASHNAVEYLASKNPQFMQAYEQTFQEAKARGKNLSMAKAQYRIPVVVHVVYNNEVENVPDSVIYDQIKVLNEDYARLNADSANLRDEFNPLAGIPDIQFVLASRDPQGNPTTGITRTHTDVSGGFTDLQGFMQGDMSSLERIKSTADGGEDPWDPTRYMNLWIANMDMNIGGQSMTALLGYSTPPPNLPNWPAGSTNGMADGVVINYNVVGRNNPNAFSDQGYIVRGRTATHEVGHYLGLRHIWGDSQDCNSDDGVADTPNATGQSNSDCDTTKNTCTNDQILVNGDTLDLPDMVENYMDYSAETCQNTFTKGQVDLMKGVLEGPRHDLVYDNEMLLTPTLDQISANCYPNPTNGSFTMTFNKDAQRVEVLDLNGKQIMNLENVKTKTTIDLGTMQAGVYLVKFGPQLQNSSKVVKL